MGDRFVKLVEDGNWSELGKLSLALAGVQLLSAATVEIVTRVATAADKRLSNVNEDEQHEVVNVVVL